MAVAEMKMETSVIPSPKIPYSEQMCIQVLVVFFYIGLFVLVGSDLLKMPS